LRTWPQGKEEGLELQGAKLELGKDCTLFTTIVQALSIFTSRPLANDATVLIFKVKGDSID
jgi:hypothetical protein